MFKSGDKLYILAPEDMFSDLDPPWMLPYKMLRVEVVSRKDIYSRVIEEESEEPVETDFTRKYKVSITEPEELSGLTFVANENVLFRTKHQFIESLIGQGEFIRTFVERLAN